MEEFSAITSEVGRSISHELALAMIEYMSFPHRVLFPEQAMTWQEFHSSNSKNFEKFAHLTSSELSVKFVNEILPNIYDYKLNASQIKSFEILNLHTEYRRLEQGYNRLPLPERLTASWEPRLNIDYCIELPTFQPPVSPCRKLDRFSLSPDLQNIHTVVSSGPRQVQRAGAGFQFSARCRSLISAVLSNDFELSGCVILEPKEIQQRLRVAKANFEERAAIPKNFLSSENFLLKLQNLSKLRRALAHITDESLIE